MSPTAAVRGLALALLTVIALYVATVAGFLLRLDGAKTVTAIFAGAGAFAGTLAAAAAVAAVWAVLRR